MKIKLALAALASGCLSLNSVRANFDGPYAFPGYPGPFTTNAPGGYGVWNFLPTYPSVSLSVTAFGTQAQISLAGGGPPGQEMLVAPMITNGTFQCSWQVSSPMFLPQCGFWSNGVTYPFQLAGPGTMAQGTFTSPVVMGDMCGWYVVQPGPFPATLTISNFTAGLSGGSTNPVVVFADTNLEAVVRTALGIPTGEITPSNMLTLTSLSAESQNIANLGGLEWATNLTYLDLNSNPLTNSTALTSLVNLYELHLIGCGYADASPLAGLTNLEYLYLSGNPLADASPLAGLTRLRELDLGFDQLTEVSPLTNLTGVYRLWLQGNNISNVAPLATMRSLLFLIVGDNPLTNPAALAPARWLEQLSYDRVGLQDVSWIAAFTNLHYLYLDGNPITNHCALTPLAPLLLDLEMPDTGLRDISCFGAFTNLVELGLGGNSISKATVLASLPKLVMLSLMNNQLTTLPSFAALTNLVWVDLRGNHLRDLNAFAGLTGLQTVYALDNDLQDISGLASMAKPAYVILTGNLLDTRPGSAAMTIIALLQSRGGAVYYGGQRALPPLLLAPQWLGGQFQFTVSGTAGAQLDVLATANFQDWTALGTVTNTTGSNTFTMPATNPAAWFYRVMQH